MSKKVYITGLGIISAIGNSVTENYKNLCAGISGISKLTSIKSTLQKPVGEIKLSNNQLVELLQLDSKKEFSRTSLLGMFAAKQAVENAKISDISEFKTGLISATTVAGMTETEFYYKKNLKPETLEKYIETHEPADSTEKIADFLGISDFMTTISTACSSSANAIMNGARMIKHGLLDRAVVGGTDALSKFTLNGFNTLQILDNENCKPFDENRKGLNLGEAAAFLVLESEEIVKQKNKKILAEISGYANANDAYHQTASSPEGHGAFLAMNQALKLANINPHNIDYVNVHGTGTANNDLSESKAMIKLFNGKVPKFSSTKSFTGHTLAAAGAVEAVFSVLSIQNNVIFPNLNFQTPIKETNLAPEIKTIKNFEIKNVLSNSFGFGGNGTALIFSKIKF